MMNRHAQRLAKPHAGPDFAIFMKVSGPRSAKWAGLEQCDARV